MKQTILLLLLPFLFTTFATNAQPYESMFGSSSTAWVFIWSNLPGTVRDSAYVEKDTTVSGIVYKKVRLLMSTPAYHNALLREDVMTGEVWYREADPGSTPADTVERVIYDFSLQVGDTFRIDNVVFSDRLDTVESIQTVNGVKHIYFKSKFYDGEPFTMIEGVGSNLGVMAMHNPSVLQAQYLLCAYKNSVDQGKYVNKRYNGNCSPPLAVKNIAAEDMVHVYPNPANDHVSINTGTKIATTIKLYDVVGKLIKEISPVNMLTIVDVHDIARGVYHLHVNFGEETVVHRLVVQ